MRVASHLRASITSTAAELSPVMISIAVMIGSGVAKL